MAHCRKRTTPACSVTVQSRKRHRLRNCNAPNSSSVRLDDEGSDAPSTCKLCDCVAATGAACAACAACAARGKFDATARSHAVNTVIARRVHPTLAVKCQGRSFN